MADLAARLEAAHDALAAGDTLKARRLLAALLAEQPEHRDVRMLAVSTYLSTGATDQAHATLELMLTADPDDAMALLAKANCCADFDGDPEAALPFARRATGLLEAWRRRAPDDDELATLFQEALLLLAECESDTGDFAGALVSARGAIEARAGARPEARLLFASCAYDACACDEARDVVLALIAEDDAIPAAHHLLGCVAIALGRDDEAAAAFARAAELDPNDFFAPVRVDRSIIEAELREAAADAPEPVRGLIAGAALEIAERPDLDEMKKLGRSPASVCVADGPSAGGASMQAPTRVRVYQRTLEMVTATERELSTQLLGELVAAVGHYLGVELDDSADIQD